MMLGEVGNPRTGKTLMNFKINKVIADNNPDMKFYLNYPPYNPNPMYSTVVNPYKNRMMHPITPAQLLRLRLPFEHMGTVAIDELWKWLQARGSGGAEINKVIGVIVFEHGKRGFDINWNSQLGSSIDRYVRIMTPKYYYSLTPSKRYFRYGYASETYHGGRKIIRLKLSKAVAEANYYPFFNTMYSPDFATAENTPTWQEVKEGNNNTLNDLNKEFPYRISHNIPTGLPTVIHNDMSLEHNLPPDIDKETDKKDMEDVGIFTAENDALLRSLTGKTIIDGTDLIKQLKEVRKDVVIEGEKLP
jgi:hypothetical protein